MNNYPHMHIVGALAARLRLWVIVNALFGAGVVHGLWRRALHGPLRSGWSWFYECMIAGIEFQLAHGDTESVEMARAAFAQLAHLPLASSVTVTPISAGGVAAERLSFPRADGSAIMLYLHGGGYFSGSPSTHRRLVADLAGAAGIPAVVVDYRLMPEHPYPAALGDAWSAYWWLLAQGFEARRIVVAGESAGAGLAVALLLLVRETNLPQPAGCICFSPWVDMGLTGATLIRNQASDYLNLAAMGRAASLVLAGRNPHDSYLSPIYADLHGLAPLLIQAGTAEMLFDDAARLAKRASAAGVTVEFEPWENMAHAWHFMAVGEPKARAAIGSAARFARRQVGLVDVVPRSER